MDPRILGGKIEQRLNFRVCRIGGSDNQSSGIGSGGDPWNRAFERPTRCVGTGQDRGSSKVLSAGRQMADPDRDPMPTTRVLGKKRSSDWIA